MTDFEDFNKARGQYLRDQRNNLLAILAFVVCAGLVVWVVQS